MLIILNRWEDQEKIRKKIEEGPAAGAGDTGGKKGGKKGGKGAAAGGQVVDGTLLGDFRTEYAKSGAAKCRREGCEEKIKKVCVYRFEIEDITKFGFYFLGRGENL